MRRLALVSSDMVSFVELGAEQIKISDLICTAVRSMGKKINLKGASPFQSVAFDLFRTSGMIFVSTENNEIAVFNPLKASSGTECRLTQFVPVDVSGNSSIVEINAVMNYLYVVTT